MKMEDYTHQILDGKFTPPAKDLDLDESDPSGTDPLVTVEMLRKRPDISEAIREPLEDMLIPWMNDEVKEPNDYINKQLVSLINLDPFIRATVMECLIEYADCTDREGEEMYRPSIFDTDVLSELAGHEFRENHSIGPAKYDHLDVKYQNMIYNNPEARKIISRMSQETITPELVTQLCS